MRAIAIRVIYCILALLLASVVMTMSYGMFPNKVRLLMSVLAGLVLYASVAAKAVHVKYGRGWLIEFGIGALAVGIFAASTVGVMYFLYFIFGG